jgi:hypothetical protein
MPETVSTLVGWLFCLSYTWDGTNARSPERRVREDGTYTAVDFKQPASVEIMGHRLKTAAFEAGFQGK